MTLSAQRELVRGKVRFPFTLLPHFSVRVIAFINDIQAAVITQAVCCGDFFQSTFKAVIKTGNLIPKPR